MIWLMPAVTTQFQPTVASNNAYSRIMKVVQNRKEILDEEAEEIRQILNEAFKNAPSGTDLKARDDFIAKINQMRNELQEKITSVGQENQILKKQYKDLKNENTKLKNEKNELKNKNHQLDDKNQKLKQKQVEFENQIIAQNQFVNQIMQRNKKQEIDYADLKTKCKLLEDSLQASTDQHQKLQIVINTAEKNYTLLEIKYKSLEVENEELKINSDDLKSKYHSLEAQYKELHLRNWKIESYCVKLEGEYAILKDLLNEIEKTNAELEAEVKKHKKRADELQAKIDFYAQILKMTLPFNLYDSCAAIYYLYQYAVGYKSGE